MLDPSTAVYYKADILAWCPRNLLRQQDLKVIVLGVKDENIISGGGTWA